MSDTTETEASKIPTGLSIDQLKEICFKLKDLNKPILLTGPPGMGKTSMFDQLAKEWGSRYLGFLTSTMDPTDSNGVPFPIGDVTKFLPPEDFNEMTTDAKDQGPVVAVFDDLMAADEHVFNSLLAFFDRRRVGQKVLRSNVFVAATGNRVEDQAGARELTTALANRFFHFDIALNYDGWRNWAIVNGVQPEIVAFINANRQCLFQFNPGSGERAFATPRTVEMASLAQEALGVEHPLLFEAVKAACGEGWSQTYRAFIKHRKNLVAPDKILKDPENCPVPNKRDVDVLHITVQSLTHAIVANPTPEKVIAAFTYGLRLPHPDMGMVLAKDLFKNVVFKSDDPTFKVTVTGSQPCSEMFQKYGHYLAG